MNKLTTALACALIIVVGCDDAEEHYSPVPAIQLEDFFYAPSDRLDTQDSLVFSFSFTDGDEDLGLSEDDTDPNTFTSFRFYLESEGKLMQAKAESRYSDLPLFISPTSVDSIGKLVNATIAKTRALALPDPDTDAGCHYATKQIAISADDAAIFDQNNYQIKEVLSAPGKPVVYILEDRFYTTLNENFYNIFVEFYEVFDNGTTNQINFDAGCAAQFSGRFPKLSAAKSKSFHVGPFFIEKKTNKRGTITYAMKSFGFKNVIGQKSFKVRVSIQDRALHRSNVIETSIGTLESFKR